VFTVDYFLTFGLLVAVVVLLVLVRSFLIIRKPN